MLLTTGVQKMEIKVHGLMQIQLVKRSSYAENAYNDKCTELEQQFMEGICQDYFEEVSANIEQHDGYFVLEKANGVIKFSYPPYATNIELNGPEENLDNPFEVPMFTDNEMPWFNKTEETVNVLLGITEDSTQVQVPVKCTLFTHKQNPDYVVYLINRAEYLELCREHKVKYAESV